jgi:putative redox protein
MADDDVDPPRMDYRFESSGLTLSAHLSEPQPSPAPVPALVLCHGFPVRGRESPASGKSFPELADRIATEMGWLVLTINFRGCGSSEGNFSLSGWMDDIAAATGHVRDLGAAGVWLAGFGSGGTLCLCQGARDASVLGVAAMGAPADFADWGRNPRQLLLHARQVGVIKDPAYPPSFDRWAQELRDTSGVDAVPGLSDRPLLLLHGETDDLVPSLDARLLADAHGAAELRIISGAGHELRHDPRAVAVFLGWLSRQSDALVTG